MRTTPRTDGAARRTAGGTAAASSGPASGGRSVIGSVRVIARPRVPWSVAGRDAARPGSSGSRAVPAPGARAGSGRRGREVRVVGLRGALVAVGARGAPGGVDVVRQTLHLKERTIRRTPIATAQIP